MQAERGTPEERVLVLGFSACACMAVNLVCTVPDAVTGIGVLAGGPYRCAAGSKGAIQCVRGTVRDGAAAAVACGRTPAVRVSLCTARTIRW